VFLSIVVRYIFHVFVYNLRVFLSIVVRLSKYFLRFNYCHLCVVSRVFKYFRLFVFFVFLFCFIISCV